MHSMIFTYGKPNLDPPHTYVVWLLQLELKDRKLFDITRSKQTPEREIFQLI